MTGNRGADFVMVAAATQSAQTLAVRLAAIRGCVCFFARMPLHQGSVSLDTNAIHYWELRVIGSHGSTAQEHKEALGLLERRVIPVADLITEFPLNSIDEAFRKADGTRR